jgi:hypothetical protein
VIELGGKVDFEFPRPCAGTTDEEDKAWEYTPNIW